MEREGMGERERGWVNERECMGEVNERESA